MVHSQLAAVNFSVTFRPLLAHQAFLILGVLYAASNAAHPIAAPASAAFPNQ